MLFNKTFVTIIISFLLLNVANSQEIVIINKVNNEIITNIDIENEKKYLLLLNNNLNKLSEIEFFNLAKDSLIKEKIKKNEIDRLFVRQNDKVENKIFKNFYKKLGYDKEKNFIEFLNQKKIKFENLKEKLIIEALWNQLIFKNFNSRVKIDKKLIEKEIIEYYKSKDKKFQYQLSEIVISNEKDINLKKKEILKYIDQFGFKIAANKYSKSETSKYGGDLGWIKGTRLSNKIKKKISKIKIGEISEPIAVSNGYIFLKINNKKQIEEKFDLEKELKQQIIFEKNRQLNQFSLNYYKKLKKNANIHDNK